MKIYYDNRELRKKERKRRNTPGVSYPAVAAGRLYVFHKLHGKTGWQKRCYRDALSQATPSARKAEENIEYLRYS